MAKKKRLLRQLFFSYLFITLISLVAVTWYASASLKGFLLEQIRQIFDRELFSSGTR